MNKKLILILCAVLVFALAAVLAFYFFVLDKADDANIEYDIVTVGEPDKNDEGEIIGDCHYQLVVFESDSKPFSRINKQLKAACDEFMYGTDDPDSLSQREQYLDCLYNSPYYDSLPGQPYQCTVDVKDIYIDEKYISIVLQYDWLCGGVHNRNYTGMSFEIETGKKIDVYDLFSSDRTAERKIINATLAVIEQNGYESYYDDVEEIVRNYDFSELDFFYNGKILTVYYPTYILAAGATGSVIVEVHIGVT